MASPINPVIEECKRLRKTLIPISDKYHGLMEQISSRNTLYPFVLLLGNHSSGKSSFINHILKRKVQTTGVAPTDDNFTIIGPGESDIDRNGPALVGDPDLGFSGLKAFGPVLVNHTQLKVRANTAISDFMIVDSPGMIDSPVTSKSAAAGPVGMDRGYNFEAVCRWYAERADVILLFFDPDKPGTTGETLSILTTALVGLDHKMYIILNKADQFHKIHDFARAYGSLCWNLSKVIPRKDLPRIHTMCLPVKSTTLSESPFDPTNTSLICSSPTQELINHSESNSLVSLSDTTGLAAYAERANVSSPASPGGVMVTPTAITSGHNKTFFEQGVHDLEESRAEVELETFNAPRRRVDNEISRLTETVSALLMHCKILERVMETYHDKLWRARFYTAATLVGSVVVTVAANYLCDFLLPSTAPAVPAVVASTDAATVAATSTKSAPGGYLRGTATTAASAAKAAKAALPTPAEVSSATSSLYSEMFNFRSKRTIMSWVGVMGLTATGGVIAWAQYRITRLLNTFNEKSTFEGIYRQIYQKELAAQDEFTIALGRTVLDEISVNINSEVVQRTQRVYKPDFFALNRILNEDIANLRRRASPNFPTLSTPVKLPSALSHSKGTNANGHSSNHQQYANQAPSPSTEQLEHLALAVQAQEAMSRQHHSRVHFSPSTTTSPVTTRESLQKKPKRFFDRSKGGSDVIVLDNGPAAAQERPVSVDCKIDSVVGESEVLKGSEETNEENTSLGRFSPTEITAAPTGNSSDDNNKTEVAAGHQESSIDAIHSSEAHASAGCENCVNCVDKCVQGVQGVEESKGIVCEYSQCTWNSHHSLPAQHASRTELHLQAMQLPVHAYFDAIVSD